MSTYPDIECLPDTQGTPLPTGRPIFEGRQKKGAKDPATALRLPAYQRLRDPQGFEEHLRRIDAGLATDPAAAIASSKEMAESVCKITLDDYGITYARSVYDGSCR